MSDYTIALVPIGRDVLVGRRAECGRCGAFVQPIGAPPEFIRAAFGARAAAGWCNVCCTMTYFQLEERRPR